MRVEESSPRWAPAGSELFYIAPNGKLMTASIRRNAETFAANTPTELFQTRLDYGRSDGGATYITSNYDVAADGRFLMTVLVEEGSSVLITWSSTGLQQ